MDKIALWLFFYIGIIWHFGYNWSDCWKTGSTISLIRVISEAALLVYLAYNFDGMTK